VTLTIDTLFMAVMALGFVLLLVLVIYLVDRVNALEINTRQAQDNAPKSKPADSGPFGGLSSKKLWDALSGQAPENWDADRVGDVRERYAPVLLKHIEMLFGEGVADARSGLSGTPRNTRVISTLRGSVESWLPTLENGTIYQCGVDSAQSTPETRPAIQQRLDEACAVLHQRVQIPLRQPYSSSLMPAETPVPPAAPAAAAPATPPAAPPPALPSL
jgi:hypothetical protein